MVGTVSNHSCALCVTAVSEPYCTPPPTTTNTHPSADACRRYKHMLKHMNRPRHNFYLWRIIYLHNCWVEHRRKQRQRQQAGAGAGGAGASPEGQQAEGRKRV